MARNNGAREESTRRTDDTTREHTHQNEAVQGRGWHGDSEGHAAAGRKGGQKVSRNREHMAQIGRKGGETVSRNREHMAEIGRKGGQSRGSRSTSDGGSEERAAR